MLEETDRPCVVFKHLLGFRLYRQWLESIQIAKGTGSVINGYEAITGQINMEFRKPTAQLPFYLNLFVNDALRTEANVASALQLNDRWSTITLAHVAADLLPHDGNNDGFLDEPLTNRYQLANRWLYEHQSGAQIRFGFRGLYEDRKGGQVDAGWVLPGTAPESNRWGSRILNKGINAYLKIGIPLVSHDHDHDHDLDHEQSEAGLHDDHDHEEAELHDDHDHEHDDNHVDPNIALSWITTSTNKMPISDVRNLMRCSKSFCQCHVPVQPWEISQNFCGPFCTSGTFGPNLLGQMGRRRRRIL